MSDQLGEIMDAIAYLRDEYVDVEVVSEYYGHDIMGEIVGCPISALSYTGDYIELLQKQVQELKQDVREWEIVNEQWEKINTLLMIR